MTVPMSIRTWTVLPSIRTWTERVLVLPSLSFSLGRPELVVHLGTLVCA